MSTYLVTMDSGMQLYVWSPQDDGEDDVRASVEKTLQGRVERIERCGRAPERVKPLLVQDE